MITQVNQVQSPETGLLPDNSGQNRSGDNFAAYLDEEQERLKTTLAGYGQFSFNGFFNYPELSWQSVLNEPQPEVYQKIDQEKSGRSEDQTVDQARQEGNAQKGKAPLPSIFESFTNLSRRTIQDLLAQTGWLVPNVEAQLQFSLAQTSGKLLTSLDLQSLIDEITSRITLIREKGKTEFSLGLKSGNLGDILITLTSRAAGLEINIQAQAETKKILDQQLAELTAALKKINIKIVELKVEEVKGGENHA